MRWAEVWTPVAPAPCSREVTHEPILTAPNTITVVRTVVSIVLAMTAVAQTSAVLLVAAYLVYWVGDMADGEVARRLGLETRIGAVFDIVADRANSLTCAVCFVATGEGTEHLVHRAGVPGRPGRLGNGLRHHGPGRQGLVVPAVERAHHHSGAGGET